MAVTPNAMAAAKDMARRRFLTSICLVISFVILVAGLWPFNFRAKNEVTWLDGQDGIRFGRRGIAYSTEPLYGTGGAIPPGGPMSIELAVRPMGGAGRAIAQILTLYGEEDRHFCTLAQWKTHLILRATSRANARHDGFTEVSAMDVLSRNTPAFLTVTSQGDNTAVYANGQLMAFTTNVPILPIDPSASGRLVLGNAPSGRNPWKGELLFLAFYDRALSAEEVLRHFQDWTAHRTPAWPPAGAPTLLYRFDERKGLTSRNQVGARNELSIPAIHQVLQKDILRPPWKERDVGRFLIPDVVANIVGFLPFGFFFAACLRKGNGLPRRSHVVLIVASCVGISMPIELLQVFLPTRTSSLTDLICNVLGTILGIYLFRWSLLFLRVEKRISTRPIF